MRDLDISSYCYADSQSIDGANPANVDMQPLLGSNGTLPPMTSDRAKDAGWLLGGGRGLLEVGAPTVDQERSYRKRAAAVTGRDGRSRRGPAMLGESSPANISNPAALRRLLLSCPCRRHCLSWSLHHSVPQSIDISQPIPRPVV